MQLEAYTMPAYHRTQILLESKQHAALTAIAAEEQRSVSALMREVAGRFLAERDTAHKREKTLEWLENATILRKQLAATRTFADPVDVLNEVYEDEDADWERLLQGEE